MAATDEASAAALSRERIKALLRQGAVRFGGLLVQDPSALARDGAYELTLPDLVSDEAVPQALPLTVLFEDAHLIVIDKAAGMAAHPAPGTPDGTLVNALAAPLRRERSSGVGGVLAAGDRAPARQGHLRA